MLKTVRNAFKVEDIRKRLLYTLLMLVVVRFDPEKGSELCGGNLKEWKKR